MKASKCKLDVRAGAVMWATLCIFLGQPSQALPQVRIPMKSPPNPMQSGMHSGANRQSEKSERSDAGILFIT